MTLVKVCGIRTLVEGHTALCAGANFLGFIFWEAGKRYIAPREAARIIRILRVQTRDWFAVGVVVDPTPESVRALTDLCDLDYIQLSGDEPAVTVAAMPRPTLKTIHIRPGQEQAAVRSVAANAFAADLYLLDTYANGLPGGTGKPFDWAALQAVGPRCLVAGGLRLDNVADALTTLAPLGVDVSSGVEFPTGGKDPRLIRDFLETVKTHDARPR